MSYRLTIARLVCLAISSPAICQQAKQELGQLDSSPTLFAVLAAVNAAGYDAGIDSPSNHWLRKTIRDEVARRNPPSIEQIREFLRVHRQEDSVWELRQYVSFALLVDGPPDFKFRLKEHDLPPDILALADLGPLMSAFYREAKIEELWQRSQPAIEEVIARYHQPATKAITEVSGYLRAPLGVGYMGRRFQILLDVLGAPNQIQLHNFLDDFFLVLTNSAEPQADEIRSAYLHFLLDPLAMKASEEIEKRRSLADFAHSAPFLADHYKDDFLLLTTKSLVLAVEARLAPAAEREQRVREAMSRGYVLAAHFYEQLPLYEKQERAMRLYFPDLITSIDTARETKRLAGIRFSQTPPVRKAAAPPPPAPPALSQAEKSLEEAEALYNEKKFDDARTVFARVLTETSVNALQAKAYYGLGRIAARVTRDPETVVKLFEKALELKPPPQERAWTLVYLGRLAEAANDYAAAARHYRAATEVEGASPAAHKAAEQGLQKTLPEGSKE